MNSMAAKFLSRHGSKILRKYKYELLRMNSGGGSSSSSNNNNNNNNTSCTKDACPPPKAESCLPDKDKNVENQGPSCSVLPCPPRTSGLNPDPNNPCNYCPPECIDPEEGDLVKLKKKQCLFQQDNDIPVYLKGGKFDVILYQTTCILTLLSVAIACYNIFKMIK